MSDQQQNPSQQMDLPLDPLSGLPDPEEAILARWKDPQVEVSAPEEAEAADTQAEETELELLDEEADEETEEDDEATEVEVLADEQVVEITVDGNVVQASVNDLKRLYGQEASLTRKSQETAKLRKEAETSIQKTGVVMQRLMQQAVERAKPYQELDMMLASKQLSDADFAQLRKEAKDAEDNLKFVKEEADGYFRDLQQQQQAQLREQATEAVKTLQETIPDWSNNLYNDIRAYAVSQGLQQEMVDTIVDPAVVGLLNKARMFDAAQKVATKKRKAPAKRVLKSKKAPQTAAAARNEKQQKLAAKAAASNDADDVTALIMSRWEQ
jgi:alkylated DNA nucleotide flippase Atl1